MQWLKRYYDINANGGESYDAVARRKGQDLFYILGGGKVGGTTGSKAPAGKTYQPTRTGASKLSSGKTSGVSAASNSTAKKTTKPSPSTGGQANTGVDPEQVKQLESEIQESKLNMDTLEKERDFYFGKLRDIEMFLQANQGDQTPLTEQVLKVLYASEDEKVQIDDSGNLTIIPMDGAAIQEEGAEEDMLMEEELKNN